MYLTGDMTFMTCDTRPNTEFWYNKWHLFIISVLNDDSTTSKYHSCGAELSVLYVWRSSLSVIKIIHGLAPSKKEEQIIIISKRLLNAIDE
uniref:Bm1161 n=1 Tax=Brugia malayi TaxID=6279 RepID=A0A0J9Y7E5_BRUMA|nr:Bm1161 [Brugia malayi]